MTGSMGSSSAENAPSKRANDSDVAASLRGLVPRVYRGALALLELARARGWRYRVTSVRRSRRLQTRLHRNYQLHRARGLTDAEIVARFGLFHPAPPGRSMHQLGRAFDVVFDPPGAQAQAGAIWQSWGGRWGGASDPVHFEA